MNFKEYQEKAATLAFYLDRLREEYPELPDKVLKLVGLSYAGLGLGECGETQNIIKKIIRDDVRITEEKREKIRKELGDVLWYVAAVCTELNIDMEEVATLNMEKLLSRKLRDLLHGSGDDR